MVAPGSGKVTRADQEVTAIETNTVKLSNKLVADMAILGVQVETAGMVKVDLGFAMATRTAVHRCVEQLQSKLVDEDGKQRAVEDEELHLIANSLLRLSKAGESLNSKNITHEPKSGHQDKAPRASFAPGQNVQFNVVVNTAPKI